MLQILPADFRIFAEMPVVTREDREKALEYEKGCAYINSKQKEILVEQKRLKALAESMSQSSQALISIAPKHWHAEEALKWVAGGTAKDSRTLTKAAQLLNAGELPGEFYDVKVKISVRYISDIKLKLEAGKSLQDRPGKPPNLSNFEIEFITFVLDSQQMRAKSVLLSTVQMLVRVICLTKRGAVAVADLDARVAFKKQRPKNKRGRKKAAMQARREDSGSDTEDDEADPSDAVEDAFESLKKILGDALSLQLALPEDIKYPTRRQVRKLCKKNNWKVKKAQSTSPWRYDGVSPPIIASFFSNTLRIFVQFEIVVPGQKANCDEKRLNSEFEKSGRCLAVVCTKPKETLSGHNRMSITNSASSTSIVGLSFLPIIDANNDTLAMFFMRKGDPTSLDSKRKEAAIWNACYQQFEQAGIYLVVMTTLTGYMNAEAFVLCMCHYLFALHRKKGCHFTFADPRNPRIEECPALSEHQVLFLDNASHHKLGSVLFQMDCRVRKLQLVPFPWNTTNLLQPLDQDVLKLFTMWVMQFFLLEMEMEMAGGIRNALHLVLWAQQVTSNEAHLQSSSELILDLQADHSGNPKLLETLQKLNATLEHANTQGGKFDEVRVAKVCVRPWLAALKHGRKSFEHAGLAAPDVPGPQLRNGRQTLPQLEHEIEAMARHELYPERITSTSLFINAAEKYDKLQAAAEEDRLSMYTRGAHLVGALPDARLEMVCVGHAGSSSHAAKVAEVIWGANPSNAAVELSKVIVQAHEFVEDQESKRQRLADYNALMPNGVVNLQQHVQGVIGINVNTMREKVKHVERSFEIVVEKATCIEKACTKLESQWTSMSTGPFRLAENQKLLLTIHEQRPKLAEKSKNLDEELNKKLESRQKFVESSRSDFVPEAELKEVLGEELHQDWGAAMAVSAAVQAISRVSEFVYYAVADRLATCALQVDADVMAILDEVLGEEPADAPQ